MSAIQHPAGRIYCGREGFLSVHEFIERTEEDIKSYAAKQPLKFKTAMRSLFPINSRFASVDSCELVKSRKHLGQ